MHPHLCTELEMKTKLAKEMGLEAPIFAFTRSKEVVVEVSRAGGVGVLGAINLTAEQLDEVGQKQLLRRALHGALLIKDVLVSSKKKP